MNRTIIGAAYLLVILVCVGISAWTTYLGYFTLIGRLAAALAFVIGVALFACDIAIREKRASGASPWGPIIFLFVCMLASAPSHFNFFYNQSVGRNVTTDVEIAAAHTFGNAVAQIQTALRAESKVAPQLEAVDRELSRLYNQLTVDNNPGFGPLARRHYDIIVDTLPGLTRVVPPSRKAPVTDLIKWYNDSFAYNVNAESKKLREQDPAEVAKEQVSAIAESTKTKANEALSADRLPQENAVAAVAVYADALTRINRIARQILGNDYRPIIKDITPDSAVVDSIPHAFRAAFVYGYYPSVTIFAILFSVLIDVIPTLFVFLLVSPREETSPIQARKRSAAVRPEIIGSS